MTDDWTQDDNPDGFEAHRANESRPARDIERELRLRPEPPRVTRLSRKVLIVVGALTATGLGGALMLALQTKDAKPPEQELYTTGHKSAADGLAALPSNYAAIPKLGPPLPGDFGRAMLDQSARGTPQAQGGKMPGAAAGQPPNPVAQRQMQEDDAAKHGSVFASRASSETGPPTVRDAEPTAQETDRSASTGGSVATSAPSVAARKAAFLTAPADRKTINAGTLEPPASPYVVQAGSIIPAALVSGVRSDLPGHARRTNS